MSAYVLALKLKIPIILPEWEETKKLTDEGKKLWDEGDKLMVEGDKLWVEGDKLRDEGDKLMVEGDKLMVEGRKLYLDAIEREFGSKDLNIDWDTGEIKLYAP